MSETKAWAVVGPDGEMGWSAMGGSKRQAIKRWCDRSSTAWGYWEDGGYEAVPVRISTRIECVYTPVAQWPAGQAWQQGCIPEKQSAIRPKYCPDCGAPVRVDDSDG